jgi:hypothetical protein
MKRSGIFSRRPFCLALDGGTRFLHALTDSGIDEHPIDAAVEKAPAVARARQKLRKARGLLERQISDRRLWIEHQDLQTAYGSIREDLYFNVGYTFGLVAGRSEPHLSQQARRLAKEVRTAVLMAELPTKDIVAALQETTRAILNITEKERRK